MKDISALIKLMVGKTVATANAQDGICLQFIEGGSLNIVNDASILADGKPASLSSLLGTSVSDLAYRDDFLDIYFGSGRILKIKVDMHDSAYKGPEALVLRTSDNQVVVWN